MPILIGQQSASNVDIKCEWWKSSTSNKSSRKLQANISWILIFPEKQKADIGDDMLLTVSHISVLHPYKVTSNEHFLYQLSPSVLSI